MPDANKFKELRAMGYTISVCCALCQHGKFPSPASPWGTCSKHLYEHLKHTGFDREVSVLAYGTCPDFLMGQGKTALLGNHFEFLFGGG